MTVITAPRQKVLLVDALSSTNYFGVELPMALDPLVDLTVFTIQGTKLRSGDCRRVIEAFPEFWGSAGKVAKLFQMLGATLLLAREVWRHRRHVIHVQFSRSTVFELPLYMLMRPFLKTLVVTVHNALPHERRWWHLALYRVWYGMLDRVHVLSRHTGERLIREFGVKPEAVVFAPHGNYSRFMQNHPPAAALVTRARFGIAPDAFLVLCAGLIRPYKGVERLISAAGCVDLASVHVLVAGGCTAEVQVGIEASIAAVQTCARVEFRPGFVSNQDMSDLIAAADAVVFPYHRIDQSGALLMAMTYGAAIVASDLPGFREYVDPDVTAVLCDTADPIAFARAIEQLAGNMPVRRRMADAAQRAAQERFAWPVVAQTLAVAYGD